MGHVDLSALEVNWPGTNCLHVMENRVATCRLPVGNASVDGSFSFFPFIYLFLIRMGAGTSSIEKWQQQDCN